MARAVDDLLRHPGIWRSTEPRASGLGSVPSGFDALDRVLPGGGWPAAGLIELLVAGPGIGELRLLVPALERAIRAGQRAALVHPPHVPYAPARTLWHALYYPDDASLEVDFYLGDEPDPNDSQRVLTRRSGYLSFALRP